MKNLVLSAAILALSVTSASAQERDMTCRGAVRAEHIGNCYWGYDTPGNEKIEKCMQQHRSFHPPLCCAVGQFRRR